MGVGTLSLFRLFSPEISQEPSLQITGENSREISEENSLEFARLLVVLVTANLKGVAR